MHYASLRIAIIFEPLSGWFSNFELSDEVENQPVNSPERLWYLLSALELKLKIGNEIFKCFDELSRNSKDVATKIGLEGFRLHHALRNSEFENIVSIFLNHSQLVIEESKKSNAINQNWQEENFLKHLTFTIVVILLSQGRRDLIPLEKWQQDVLKQEKPNEEICSWLGLIEESLNTNDLGLAQILGDVNASPERRTLVALMLSVAENIDINNGFHANVILLTTSFIQSWKDEIENALESFIVEKWKIIARTQRFALLSPNISAVSIIAACNDDSCYGIRKAAKVLLSANLGVNMEISRDTIEQLSCLASN